MNHLVKVPGYDRAIDLGPHPSRLCWARWNGKLSPEPETQAWIDTLEPGKVFYDIGANVGTFSVRAALRGLQVVAFEPTLEHYVELCGIIERNKLPILAYNLALFDKTCFGVMAKGRSTHAFHPNVGINCNTDTHPIMAVSADEIAAFTAHPSYVKIDVDGQEFQVLRGMHRILHGVESLLIEIDPHVSPPKDVVIGFLTKRGFSYDPDQVEACMIKGGKYDGMANYIFRRL